MVSRIPADLVGPIFTFDVQSGGNFQSETRAIIFGHGLDAGTLGEGEIAVCSSRSDARALVGAGSMLESMFLDLLANAPAQEIWLGRVAETGTAEIRTITVGTVPAAGGQGVLEIMGEPVTVEIAAGTSANDVATALAAAINTYYNRFTGHSLPFTATAATNVVTITARHEGTYATEIDIHVPVLDRVNAFAGLFTFATTTAGAGVPSLTNILAAMNDDPFEIIVCPFNDATALTTLNGFLDTTSGRWSYLQQIYGHAFYPFSGTSTELIAKAAAKDTWHLTVIPKFSTGGFAIPGYRWVAQFVGAIAALLGDGTQGGVSVNQTGLVVKGAIAPRDRNQWMDYTTRNTFLKNGVSTWSVNTSGDVTIDKIITQSQTLNGVPDATFRDIQRVFQLTYALKRFRADLAYEHANKAIADDNPSNLANISTVKDIKATLYHSYRAMVNNGVLENASAALSMMVVTRDTDNANRVNASLPLDFVNPLDIFAGLAKAYSQF
jgi:phage tail sheath gpL-like